MLQSLVKLTFADTSIEPPQINIRSDIQLNDDYPIINDRFDKISNDPVGTTTIISVDCQDSHPNKDCRIKIDGIFDDPIFGVINEDEIKFATETNITNTTNGCTIKKRRVPHEVNSEREREIHDHVTRMIEVSDSTAERTLSISNDLVLHLNTVCQNVVNNLGERLTTPFCF